MFDNSIRAVVFDGVGTLLFPRVPVSRTYMEFARRHGMELSEAEIRAAFGDAFARQESKDAQNGWRTDEARERERWRAIVGEVLPHVDCDRCFADLWQYFGQAAAWAVNSDADAVLAHLANRGLTLGIASNFDARLAGILAKLPELANLRDRCVVSSTVGWRKPAREFFSAIAEVADCKPNSILYVGDDLRNDMHGATSAGLRATLFDPENRAGFSPRIGSLRDLLTPSGVSQYNTR
jgi:putative hydrolase of the HAD superfamily